MNEMNEKVSSFIKIG